MTEELKGDADHPAAKRDVHRRPPKAVAPSFRKSVASSSNEVGAVSTGPKFLKTALGAHQD